MDITVFSIIVSVLAALLIGASLAYSVRVALDLLRTLK